MKIYRIQRLTVFLGIALLCVLALLVGCGGKASLTESAVVEKSRVKTAPQSTEADFKTPEEEFYLDSRAFAFYTEAVVQEMLGRPDSAALYLREAWRYFPESQEIGLALATNLFRIRKTKLAVGVLGEVEPKDAEVYELLAACYYDLNMQDSLRHVYVKLTQVDPDNPQTFNYLAGLYRSENKVDSAAWAYQNLARIMPDNFRVWQELGRARFREGKLPAARDAFGQSIQLDSSITNVISMAGLGEVYAALGRPDSAEAAYKMALQADPSSQLVHSLLVSYYIDRDLLPQALEHARTVDALAPEDKYAKRRLGLIYMDLDSLKQADRVFTELVESGDQTWFNYSYLGQLNLRTENFARAAESFEKAVLLNDSSAALYLNLGLAYRSMKKVDDEINTYKSGLSRVTQEGRGFNALHFALAIAYEQSEQVDAAALAFEEVLRLDPDNPQALNYLGYMLADRGLKMEYARDLIARAVELSPDNAAFLDSYGWVYYRLGDYKEAVKYLKQAVALDSDPVIFDHLGDVYNALGESRQARVWWQKALELAPDDETLKEKLVR